MKLIIAGGRNVTDFRHMQAAIAMCPFDLSNVTEEVSGTAPGADRLGERWASIHRIKCKRFPADWNAHGVRAGVIRNQEMADYCEPQVDVLIALWDGNSPGTKHMINAATKRGLQVYVHRVDKEAFFEEVY